MIEYKLTNIETEYEVMTSGLLAQEMSMEYESGREFFYDDVFFKEIVPIKKDADTQINIKVNAQMRSMKAILLLFIEPYTAGARDSEKFVFPDLKKIKVTINGRPGMLYNDGFESRDIWARASRFFIKEEHAQARNFMTLKKFYTEDKFSLLFDLRSMASQKMHGSGMRLVNSTDGVYLSIEQKKEGSGTLKCHIFVISDAQLNIMNKQLESVQY